MNDVNKVAARKLRSLAAAARADDVDDPVVRGLLALVAGDLEERAANLAPAIEEPQEFGSVIRASSALHPKVLWQRSPMQGKHYWESETGAVEVWPELTDVEVLRVGVGEAAKPQPVEELVGVLTDPEWKPTDRWKACIGGAIDSIAHRNACPVCRPARFCTLTADCRMADGHNGGCER